MKLHKLVMQAFGPYTGRVELDFDKGLAGSTMFLIHGMTGAGKTTILDAIAFALYGEASGSDRSGTMLRSDFVDKNVKTEVELTFSLGSTCYRVHRTPSYAVEGNKSMRQTTAALYEITGEEEHLVAGKPGDVTVRLVTLTGFRPKEFRQVVLLPQGEFRRFLLAKSNERSKLMTTLFDTGRYGLLEAKLKERAGRVQQESEENRKEQTRLLEEAGAESLAALQKMAEEEAAGIAAKQQAVETAGAQQAAAQKALADGQALAGWFQKLAKAEADQKADEEKQPHVESFRAKLAEATKAAALIDKEEQMKKSAERAQKSVLDAKRAAEASQKTASAAKAAEASWAQVQAETKTREAAKLHVQKLGEAQKQVRALHALKQQARAAEQAQKRESKAYAKAVENVAAAKKTVERLHLLERAGKAFSLAQGLVEGEPCPVCGSTQHPHPATTEDLVPTEDEIKNAEGKLTQAEKTEAARQAAKSKSEAEASALEGQLKAARAALPQGVPEDEAAVAQAYAEAVQKADALEAAYAAAQKNVQEATSARASAQAKAESAEAFANAQQEAAKQAQSAFDDALVVAGFADAASYQKAIEGPWRTEKHRKEVEQHIRRFEDAKLQHKTQREEAASQTAGKMRPDLAALEAVAQAAGSALRQAVERAKAAELRLQQEQTWQKRLEKLQKEQAALEAKARVVGRLAQVACAEHPYRVHFQTYIQRSIFRDVMAAANERLYVMSGGRYALEIGKESNGHAFEGLAISVFDGYTGKARETSSLSGGESFLASLALALGLADTVTRYTEGIRLDTMFIDEGFGTLDTETLDLALKALVKLQDGGRVIGIISHVEELAARIPDRIEVTKTMTGSTAAFVHGTMAE